MQEKEEEQGKIQQAGRMGHWVWPSGTFPPAVWGLGWAGLGWSTHPPRDTTSFTFTL